MSTVVEQASKVEHGIQTNVTSTSSAASTSSPKISKFAAKSGFVIPKNKLSGSLVPVFRGSKKPGESDPISDESSKDTRRKTKWGPDMMQDAAVKKGKAAAYQTRVDQITKQLNSGIMDIEEDPSRASQFSSHESSGHSEKSEVLELERREAIGEILKLNPSYKAPANYKPLLREARVPIPIKDYPGYNFISLVYGPGSDTQKRLEKETGAKIHVFGTKSDKRKKEVIADESDNQNLYEELYVHVCADTYEKVDAAVALIELLVTPVLVNTAANPTSAITVSSNNVNAVHTSQGTPSPYIIPHRQVNQEVVQSVTGPAQVQPLGQFQPYPGAWFPTSSPLGFITQQNFSAPMLISPVQMSSASLNSADRSSLFGPRPAGFGSVQSPSFVPSRPQPLLQQPYMPRAPTLGYNSHPGNHPMPTLHNKPGQSNISAPPFSGTTPTALGPPQVIGPLVPPSAGPPTFAVQSAIPSGISTAWSQAPTGPSNLGQMTLLVGPPQRPHPVTSQPSHLSGASPFSVTSGNMVSPMSTPFQPTPSHSSTSAATAMTRPMQGPPNRAMAAAPISWSMPSTLTPPPHPQSGVQISGAATSPAPTPKPPHPSLNDFTFQPNRPQNPAPHMTLKPNIQAAPHGLPPRNPNMHPPQTHQISSFHPPVQNSAPPPAMQGFSRPQVSNHINQPRVHMSSPSAGNPIFPHGPPRHPAFPSAGPVSPATSVPQMGMGNFSPGSQVMNASGAFPFRPGNTIQPQPNYPTGPQDFFSPNQQFNRNFAFPSSRPSNNSFGSQQNYDPFSPTSVPLRPPQLGGNPSWPRKQESDPEYEDLMASVGVK